MAEFQRVISKVYDLLTEIIATEAKRDACHLRAGYHKPSAL